jgi:predicted regulator of Ras-like GTPase activity (Roadblock/LC7/MglB family)
MNEYTDALEGLSRVRGVRGALLVHAEDGIVIAEALMDEVDGRAVAALTAALVQRLARTAGAAGAGAPSFVHLQAEHGSVLAVPALEDLLLVAVAGPEANVGLARLEMLETAGRLG